MRKISIVLLFCLLWLNVLTVTNDQLALKEGKTATVGLTESIIDRLIAGGYLEDGASIALVGKPSANDLFVKKSCWENANNYAQFGAWMIEPGNNYRSWSGVLLEYFGINLNVCSAEKYQELRGREEIASMPLFPMEGSIARIDGVVVVKVSEAY